MRIIKSARGFSVSVASTVVRVVMITLEGEPAAAIWENGTSRRNFEGILQAKNPRDTWRVAYYAARHIARYDLDKQRYHKFWQEEDIISGY